MKAYGYVRCSGLGQMDGDGPTRQRQAIQSFADAKGIEVVRWFEESHTGSDLEGRAIFQNMRAELLASDVRLVIVEKLDRLARSVMIQETIMADFKKHGIGLRSATEDDVDSEDPTRVLIRQILGCFFEYERKMIVLKTRAARERIRKAGMRCEGKKPYGSRPGEAAALDRIKALRVQGWQPETIANMLNDESVPTRHGKRWHSGTVSKILARHI